MEGDSALKKMLCALLAAVLTLTLMLPCAAADFAGFTDQQEIKNNNAVRMLYDLGLISGYADGSFGPQNPIRREEVAKLMALWRRTRLPRSTMSPRRGLQSILLTAPSRISSLAATGASARQTM